MNLLEIDDLYKIRITHDNSGADPAWFLEKIKLEKLKSDLVYNLDVRKWLTLSTPPHQLSVEVPIPKAGVEAPQGRLFCYFESGSYSNLLVCQRNSSMQLARDFLQVLLRIQFSLLDLHFIK